MQIRSNPYGSNVPKPGPSDITRPNREGIRETVGPIPPEKAAEEIQRPNDGERIRNAREAQRARDLAKRIQNAREGQRAEQLAKRVQNAREAQRARDLAKRVQNARQGADQVDLSAGARLIARVEGPSEDGEARSQRIAELKELVQQGRLNTPERTAQAAERMMRGDDE